MNPVVASYYGTRGVEKSSSPNSEALRLRRAYVLRREGGWDPSHPDVEALGGSEAALEKISQAQHLLDAWDEGERFGEGLAEELLLRHFDERDRAYHP